MAERILKRVIITFAVLLIGWTIGYFHHYLAVAGASNYIAEVERNPKVIAAMRYHGITFCTEVNGRHTFERSGQTCTLFTNAFERYWEKSCN